MFEKIRKTVYFACLFLFIGLGSFAYKHISSYADMDMKNLKCNQMSFKGAFIVLNSVNESERLVYLNLANISEVSTGEKINDKETINIKLYNNDDYVVYLDNLEIKNELVEKIKSMTEKRTTNNTIKFTI